MITHCINCTREITHVKSTALCHCLCIWCKDKYYNGNSSETKRLIEKNYNERMKIK